MRSTSHRSPCHLLFAALLLALLPAGQGRADPSPTSPPSPVLAVVRLPSHGASATVIHTEAGRTFLLSCAHAFQGADRTRPIRIDGPGAPNGQPRLLAVDSERDLSLLEAKGGPAPAVAPVAGPGYQPSKQLLSVGYDEMRLPATQRRATILHTDADITWTREPPWHGRSGGALLDLENGQLIGVVSGYVHPRQGPGVYVSLAAIQDFLEEQGWRSPTAPAGKSNHRPRSSHAPALRTPGRQNVPILPQLCPT